MSVEQLRAEIIQICDDNDEAQTKVDDLVHQAKSEEASRINNDGLESQIEYLTNNTQVDLVALLSELHEWIATDEEAATDG